MDSRNMVRRWAHGDAVEARLAAEKPAIAKLGKPFRATHAAFRAASVVVDEAEAKRDAALAVAGEADDVLDDALMALADDCVAAKLGTRITPFAGLSPYAPSKLIALPVATEVAAALALVAAIRKKKPTGPIVKRLATVEKNAKAVSGALKKLSAPQKAYDQALAARDALFVDWDKALRSLRRQLAAALDSDEQARALVAPAQAVQVAKPLRAPRKRKAKVAPPA